ncbi:DrmB family protein [Streptomyces zaomyceticus]|uniref:DrmB family protein n=1 Tax=Streptomyces zaomyceticus TaxID=68286 RepID=UPI003664A692
MTPPPSRRRGAGTERRAPAHNLLRRGAVRRSQMITTYGVGSLVAVDHESFVVSGLDGADDHWSSDESPRIHERRLARLLGVQYFRLPPASDESSKDGARVRRFPLMHSCPECSELRRHRDFNPPPGRSVCGTCEADLVPSRFVIACEAGHLDEFPYWHWVHRATGGGTTTAGQCGGTLTLRSSGRSSSLRSIIVSCSCGVPEVSMEGSFRRKALKDLGLGCRGTRPWLGTSVPAQTCGSAPRTLQRGSSAVWQPVLKSALSIPPWSDGRADPLAEHWAELRELNSREQVEMCLKFTFKGEIPVPVDEVMALLDAEREEDPEGEETPAFDHRYRALRHKEYERLRTGNDERERSRDEQFVCETPLGDPAELRLLGVTGPMLVKKLREVRALKAFTRLADLDSTTEGKEAALSASEQAPAWLPAMEVRGEGVFLRLDADRLDAWERSTVVAARAERMRTAHERLIQQRASDPTRVPASPATPRMVLLHTLAHVLINEWSLDAGYPAASLRERLYADDDMAGILVYTATSDSAGSLGGLVAQGEPDRLIHTIDAAVRRAEWCSSDPLCVESEASGTGGTNLAACHACVMLPETSCEHNNILLDRALLVGTPEDPRIGFFAHLLS